MHSSIKRMMESVQYQQSKISQSEPMFEFGAVIFVIFFLVHNWPFSQFENCTFLEVFRNIKLFYNLLFLCCYESTVRYKFVR